MSKIFEYSDIEIWSPSNNIGNLFMAQIKALEESYKVESGIVETMADTYEIINEKFNTFLRWLMDFYCSTNNMHFKLLNNGLIKILILLNHKITNEWIEVPAELLVILKEVKENAL